VNDASNIERLFWRLAPPVAAVLLIAAFVSLGLWQLDRAAEKKATKQLFDDDRSIIDLADNLPTTDFQPISATGRYNVEQQFLIDNMISNGRLGYFVLTAFELAPEKPLLIVNRGWIASTRDRSVLPAIPVDAETQEIRGRSGHLPRVGIRPGSAFDGATGWPKLATFPELPDLSNALGRDILPFVMLLDLDKDSSLVRDWRPREQGPMTHYSYAFQWFAMAAAVLTILVWQLRKRRNDARH
jgi:surfeit locus 1 family protein